MTILMKKYVMKHDVVTNIYEKLQFVTNNNEKRVIQTLYFRQKKIVYIKFKEKKYVFILNCDMMHFKQHMNHWY